MLKSFEIRGFRTFQELKIESLGQVNLIVGKNNVGKTTLLEALRLYAAGGNVAEIGEILRDRDELKIEVDSTFLKYRIESLFHGWKPQPFADNEVYLAPIGVPEDRVVVRLAPLEPIAESDPNLPVRFREVELAETEGHNLNGDWEAGLVVEFRNAYVSRLPIEALDQRWARRRRVLPFRPPYVPASGISHEDAIKWWDSISLREAEPRVYDLLRMFLPVSGINAVGDPNESGRRTFIVRTSAAPSPVPLRSLGHGVMRAFHIALAAEQVRGSASFAGTATVFDDANVAGRVPFLLIDEFENGIYHGVIPDLWRFVFRLAKLNNLQVFVTTHSADCVSAFLRVSEEDMEVDGRVIRLEGRDEKRRAKQFGESEFSIIRESNIEVR